MAELQVGEKNQGLKDGNYHSHFHAFIAGNN